MGRDPVKSGDYGLVLVISYLQSHVGRVTVYRMYGTPLR
jgi:hypothetical protein